jgi:hypothetical protein
VKQRDQVQMTAAQAAEFLVAGRKVQLATNGPDGFPHLVTMYYAMIDGRIVFWTYRRSQKARNLERDPRISCLVETGEQYFDLRGVLVQGIARRINDPTTVTKIGRLIASVLAAPPGAAGPAQADPSPRRPILPVPRRPPRPSTSSTPRVSATPIGRAQPDHLLGPHRAFSQILTSDTKAVTIVIQASWASHVTSHDLPVIGASARVFPDE